MMTTYVVEAAFLDYRKGSEEKVPEKLLIVVREALIKAGWNPAFISVKGIFEREEVTQFFRESFGIDTEIHTRSLG
jgi:hypothetical protein